MTRPETRRNLREGSPWEWKRHAVGRKKKKVVGDHENKKVMPADFARKESASRRTCGRGKFKVPYRKGKERNQVVALVCSRFPPTLGGELCIGATMDKGDRGERPDSEKSREKTKRQVAWT